MNSTRYVEENLPRLKSKMKKKLEREQQNTVILVRAPSPQQYGTEPKDRTSPCEPLSGTVKLKINAYNNEDTVFIQKSIFDYKKDQFRR